MTPELPTMLALLGTGLLGLAIFAPARVAAAGPAVSFAPPLVTAPAERWAVPPGVSFEPPFEAAEAEPVQSAPDPVQAAMPAWPALVDPCATGCDAAARRELVDALAAVRAPWALGILERAQAEEPDPLVREAIARSWAGQAAVKV